MNQALVLRHHSWRHLIADLQSRKGCGFLRNIKQSDLPTVLAPPVALAKWIASSQPEFSRLDVVRILIAGAQNYDAFDSGRWYGLLPALLGRNFRTETTLVGENLSTSATTQLATLLPSDLPAAAMHKSTLEEYLISHPASGHDLACAFHPGFEHYHQRWFKDGSLANLVASGVPVIATSYDEAESQRDRYLLETYGYSIAGAPIINPFYKNFEKAIQGVLDVKWGHLLWKFSDRLPDPQHKIDTARIDAVTMLSNAILRSVTDGLNFQTARCGQRVMLPESEDDQDFYIHIFNDFLVREKTRKVYVILNNSVKTVEDISFTVEDWAAYPGEDTPEIERAIWGAKIKTRWAGSKA